MKIGIVGLGFVGGTHRKAFEAAGMGDDLLVHDIKLPGSKLENTFAADVIFLCLPTPTRGQVQDVSATEEVLLELKKAFYTGVVCIKSTVLPSILQKLSEAYKLRIVHCPEFLRELTAYEDFLAQNTIILGGAAEDCEAVFEIYKKALNPNLFMSRYDSPLESAMVKYTHNNFLTVKVAFFNEIYDVCTRLGISYNAVLWGALSQRMIGANHTTVPNNGKRGFGGTCFVKDAIAMISDNPELSILSAAVDSNSKFRNFDVNCKEVNQEG
jgi:UDPglucose 6-dehydrogenase